MRHLKRFCLLFIMAALFFTACQSTERSRPVEVHQTKSARTPYHGPRSPIATGRFSNRSDFMRGIFSDGEDRLGGQARTILISHLHQTNRFTVMDREHMAEAAFEAGISENTQELLGASFLVTGDVTEFGRKEVGDMQMWGVLGRGKKQIAYSKVTIYVIDVRTMAIVYSVQGAGEYELSNREVLGFGTTSSYDSTLNGKVLDLAIREAVDRLTEGIDAGFWGTRGS